MNLKNLFEIIQTNYPISLSDELVKLDNGYDNSGIIYDNDQPVTGVLFCLDLTRNSVEMAKKLGYNTIITHHPAIYMPIKKIDGAIKDAIQNNISVISMHLNFDSANLGIDHFLAVGLGAKEYKNVQCLSGGGYGKIFSTDITLGDFALNMEKVFDTKVRVYGDKQRKITAVASFCGAGLSEEFLDLDVDLFVSSDIQHHKIISALEKGKCVIDITHYKSEIYGFTKIFEIISNKDQLKNIKMQILCDERLC